MSADDEYAAGEYSSSDWGEIAASSSFGDLPTDQVMLLYRHWVWADHARREFVEELEIDMDEPVGFDYFLGRLPWAEYVWYGLLFVLSEGMTQRRVRYGGNLALDVRQVREPLNAARNATFHVGREDSYWDERLSRIWNEPDADAIDRVHWAFGRLLRAELRSRLDQSSESD